MRIDDTARRVSYLFLCVVPFIAGVTAGVRGLRVPGVYQSVGGVLFAAIVLAAWLLGARFVAGQRRRAGSP